MKPSVFYAIAFAMVFAVSSAQAVVIYDTELSGDCCFVSYGNQNLGLLVGDQLVDAWGDFIGFVPGTPRNLIRATFWLSSNIADNDIELGLIISDPEDPGFFVDSTTLGTGTWSAWNSTGAMFAYTFTFSQPLPVVPEKIDYLLYVIDPDIFNADNQLKFFLATTTKGTDETDVFFGLGDVVVGYTTNEASITNLTVGDVSYTLAARFEAVPEPATLALLGLGLAGLGFARCRKTKAVG